MCHRNAASGRRAYPNCGGAKLGQCRVSSITQLPRECPQTGKLGCWAWAEGTLLIRIVRDSPSRGTRARMQLCLIPQYVYNNRYKYRYFFLLHTLRPCFCCWNLRSQIWPPGLDTAKIKRRQHNDGTLQKQSQQNHRICKTAPRKNQEAGFDSSSGNTLRIKHCPKWHFVSELGSLLQGKIRQTPSHGGRLAP